MSKLSALRKKIVFKFSKLISIGFWEPIYNIKYVSDCCNFIKEENIPFFWINIKFS
jgi:hypothetical protein